jgi:hypothetical protein
MIFIGAWGMKFENFKLFLNFFTSNNKKQLIFEFKYLIFYLGASPNPTQQERGPAH